MASRTYTLTTKARTPRPRSKRLRECGGSYSVTAGSASGTSGADTSGDYLPLSGGTITGNLTVNGNTTLNLPEDPSKSAVVMCNEDGKLAFGLTSEIDAWLSTSHGGTVEQDVTLKAKLNVFGEAAFNAQANFCNGAYIDTSGHIHLPSGVEIY